MNPTARFASHSRGLAPSSAATVVLVHGWPDSSALWDPVAQELEDRFHVVTLDMPGVGDAAPLLPTQPGSYRLDALAEGLHSTLLALPQDQPIHLVGHDWGGVLGWRYVMTKEYAGTVASFTTMSGPSLAHMGLLVRRAFRDRALARVAAGQLARSWYTVALSVPVLRTAIWQLGAGTMFRWWLSRSEGITDYPGAEIARDAAAAVPLYRSNIVPGTLAPRVTEIRIPVHVIVAERDRYVSPDLMRTLDRWVPEIDFSDLDAGHWSPRSHPDEVAGLIGSWINDLPPSSDRG